MPGLGWMGRGFGSLAVYYLIIFSLEGFQFLTSLGDVFQEFIQNFAGIQDTVSTGGDFFSEGTESDIAFITVLIFYTFLQAAGAIDIFRQDIWGIQPAPFDSSIFS
jgi:hypothetical protein